jgi:hypothetical protein
MAQFDAHCRLVRSHVLRIWRKSTAELIIACLGLELLLLLYQLYGAEDGGAQLGKLVFWCAVDVLLLWRVWRRGRASWLVLVILDGLAIAELLLGLVWPWGLYETGLLVIVLAQLVLLVSPAVRHHHRATHAG